MGIKRTEWRAGRCRRQSLRPLLPRELQSRTASLFQKMQIAAGLRTSGRADVDRLLLHAASQTTFAGVQCQGMDRSQLPLRGSSGIAPDSLLGLALVPDTAIDHKILCFHDIVNDMAADLMACYYIQYPSWPVNSNDRGNTCSREVSSSSNERSRHLSSCCCRVVLAHV